MNILLFAQDTTNLKPLNEIFHNILTFIYFIAHQIGAGIIKVFQALFPQSIFPVSIINTLGYLIILTIFVFIVTVSRRAAWIILSIAWILLLIRILMIVFKLG